MFCNKCGKKLNDKARFCTECGNKVEKPDAEPITQPEEINPAFDAGDEKTVYLPEETPEPADNAGEPAFFGNAPTELLHEEEFVAKNIPDEDLSEEPPQTDMEFFGDEETVLLSEEQSVLSEEKTVLLKEEETPVQTSVYPKNQQYSGMDQTPAYTPSFDDDTNTLPISEPVQENDSAFGRQSSAVQPGQFNPYDAAASQYPAGQYAPPVQPYIPPQEAPAAPVKVGGGRIFGASAVAFFAIVFLILLSIISGLKLGASGGVLKKRVEKMDLNTLLNAQLDGTELSEQFYHSSNFGYAVHNNAGISEFKEYIKKTNLLEYAGGKIEKYADYILDGKGKDPSVSSEDIAYEFFDENNDAADEVFGFELKIKELERIKNSLEEEDVDKSLSVKEWNKNAGIDVQNISYITSFITMGILFALVMVLLIWIVIIVDKKGRHIMGFFGNILFISGLIVFLCGLGITVGSMIAFSLTGSAVFYITSNVLLEFGILMLIIGFSELVVGFIFKKIGKKLKRKYKLAQRTAMPVNQTSMPVPAYN